MHQQNPVDAPSESRGTTKIRRTPTESCLHSQRDPWHQRWSQIGVVCSINIQNGSIGTAFIPRRNNLKASSTWTGGEFLTDKLGPLSVVLWTRQLGQSAMEGWPWQHSVNNTGCCYRKPPAVKSWHRGGDFYTSSLVIKQAILLN